MVHGVAGVNVTNHSVGSVSAHDVDRAKMLPSVLRICSIQNHAVKHTAPYTGVRAYSGPHYLVGCQMSATLIPLDLLVK